MLKLSVVIPAHNEQGNIGQCLDELTAVLNQQQRIPYEIIVVNDNSTDDTEALVLGRAERNPRIRCVSRTPPGGFGRAIRAGIDAVTGDVVVICMADLSDDPHDVVAYYRKIEEGYDCVFGSRFIVGSRVENYPAGKRVVNRAANRLLQLLYTTRFNDLTNAFKAYRTHVIRECGPYRSSHFNITVEMSLSALIRKYDIAQIPISWAGRKSGVSNLRLRQMAPKYLYVMIKMLAARMLIEEDLIAERLAAEKRAGQGKAARPRDSADVAGDRISN